MCLVAILETKLNLSPALQPSKRGRPVRQYLGCARNSIRRGLTETPPSRPSTNGLRRALSASLLNCVHSQNGRIPTGVLSLCVPTQWRESQ